MSLNDFYTFGFKHALQNVERNGGKVKDDKVIIQTQNTKAV